MNASKYEMLRGIENENANPMCVYNNKYDAL